VLSARADPEGDAMDVLAHLTEEHRKVEAMLAVLAESEPGDEREETVSELEDALRTHMLVEEHYVYPIVKAELGTDEFVGATNEHDLARSGLEELRNLIDQPGFGGALEALAGGLHHHVSEEEQQIFPALRDKAATKIDALGDPDRLETAVEEGRSAVPGA
jgi:iron-sulfur cluster repair protein YtfE (RIC family)